MTDFLLDTHEFILKGNLTYLCGFSFDRIRAF